MAKNNIYWLSLTAGLLFSFCCFGCVSASEHEYSIVLDAEDLGWVNEVGKSLELDLGDQDFSIGEGLTALKIVLLEPVCTGLNISKLSLSAVHKLSSSLQIIMLAGSLTGAIHLESAASKIGLSLTAPLGTSNKAAELEECSTNLEVSASFTSTGLDNLLNIAQEPIIETLKEDIQKILCDTLGDVISTSLGDSLYNFSSSLEKYKNMEMEDSPVSLDDDSNDNDIWINMQTHSIFQMAFDTVNNTFNAYNPDTEQLGILDIVDSLTNNTEKLFLSLEENPAEILMTETDLFRIGLCLHEMEIIGLKTINTFNLAQPVSPQTLKTELGIDHLGIKANFRFHISTLSDGDIDSTFEKHLSLQFGLRDFYTDLALHLLMSIRKGRELNLGPLIAFPIECCLSVFDLFQASSFKLSLSNIEYPVFSDLGGNDGILEILNLFITIFADIFGEDILLALPSASSTEGKDILNENLDILLRDSICPEPEIYDDNWFNFETDEYFNMAINFVKSNFLDTINEDFIGDFTKANSGIEGKYVLQQNESTSHSTIDPFGTLTMKVSNIYVEGLDTIHDLIFMDTPATTNHPYVLRNSFKFGRYPSTPVSFNIGIGLHLTGGQAELDDDFIFSFSFTELYFLLDLLVKVSRTGFAALELQQVLNVNCLISTLDLMALQDLQASFRSVNFDLQCIKCNTPALIEMEKLAQSSENQAKVTAKFNEWFSILIARMTNELNEEHIKEQIDEANKLCIYGPENELVTSFHKHGVSLDTIGIIGFLGASLLVGTIVGCVLKFTRKSEISKPKSTTHKVDTLVNSPKNSSSNENEVSNKRPQTARATSWTGFFRLGTWSSEDADIFIESDTSGTQRTNLRTSVDTNSLNRHSLFHHPQIPIYIRLGVPAVLCTNIFLFIGGHMILAASVNLEVLLLALPLRLEGFAVFSIGGSIKQMWDAGVYPLALLVGGLSGVWPYVKVLSLLYCWMTPPSKLSEEKRGRILHRLDGLGKWSLIDVYVLLLIMVAFSLHLENPNLEVLPENFYNIQVVVNPLWGLYSFSLAAILALLANNICLLYHLNAEAANRKQELKTANEKFESVDDYVEEPMEGWVDAGSLDIKGTQAEEECLKREALCNHAFKISQNQSIKLRGISKFLVCCLITLGMVLLLVGSIIPSFSFKNQGLIGMAMDINTENSLKEFSMFDLFFDVVKQAEKGNVKEILGLYYLALSSLLSAFVAQVLCFLSLGCLWLVPLTLRRQKQMFLATEIIHAWCSLDVFIVAVIVAILEMGTLSGFLLAGACDSLMAGISNILVPYGLVGVEDATCFYVYAKLHTGAMLLVASSFIFNVCIQIVLRTGKIAIDQRETDVILLNLEELEENDDQYESFNFRSTRKEYELDINTTKFRRVCFKALKTCGCLTLKSDKHKVGILSALAANAEDASDKMVSVR